MKRGGGSSCEVCVVPQPGPQCLLWCCLWGECDEPHAESFSLYRIQDQSSSGQGDRGGLRQLGQL